MADENHPPQPAPKPIFSGTTQIVVASIGAIGTISGALIAANWGRGHAPEPAPTATRAPFQFPTPVSSYAPAPPQPQPMPPAQPATIDAVLGDWRMPDGTVTTVSQNDEGQIEVNSRLETPAGTQMFAGRGEIVNGYLHWVYNGNTGDSGECITQLSQDGSRMQGYCRHASGLANQIALVR